MSCVLQLFVTSETKISSSFWKFPSLHFQNNDERSSCQLHWTPSTVTSRNSPPKSATVKHQRHFAENFNTGCFVPSEGNTQLLLNPHFRNKMQQFRYEMKFIIIVLNVTNGTFIYSSGQSVFCMCVRFGYYNYFVLFVVIVCSLGQVFVPGLSRILITFLTFKYDDPRLMGVLITGLFGVCRQHIFFHQF
jgi:magnesium-transporting ATPase (P-type)